MKKIVCSFVFGLVLMVAGAQAWADTTGGIPPAPPNPKVIDGPVTLADTTGGIPPITPNLRLV